jgi:hypothetical protein
MPEEERRWIAGIATPKGGADGPAYGIVAGLQIVTLDHGWGFRPEDAHLIAAAPDLLIGCREATGCLVEMREIYGESRRLNSLIARLMDVTAKAGGKP